MDYETALKEYHQRIGEIFLVTRQTPFRICKQMWALHVEFSRRIAMDKDDSPKPEDEIHSG